MAKNISLLGADYPDVPAVQLPQTGGGTATFYDIETTSGTSGTNSYYRSGNTVVILIKSDNVSTTANAWNDLFRLPSEYRPPVDLYAAGYDNITDSMLEMRVKTDGIVSIYAFSGKTTLSPRGNITFCVT